MEKKDIDNIKEIFITQEDRDISGLQKQELHNYIDLRIDEIEESFKLLCDEFSKRFRNHEWIIMNKSICYVSDISAFIPNLDEFECYSQNGIAVSSISVTDDTFFEGFLGSIPTEEEAHIFLSDNNIYKLENDKIRCFGDEFSGITCSSEKYFLLTDNGFKGNKNVFKYGESLGTLKDLPILTVPVYRLKNDNIENNSANILFYWLQQGLRPKVFKNSSAKSVCELLNNLYKKNKNWFEVIDNNIVFKNKDDIKKYFYANCLTEDFYFLPEIRHIRESNKVEADDEFIEDFKNKLIKSENVRCDLPLISAEYLTGINLGLWDLFDYNELRKDNCIKKVTLPEDKPIYFRNPRKDISDSFVAIDFGTKSTVVCYKNSNNEFLPIKVAGDQFGDGNIDLYENPSVMHFKDLEKFSKDYKLSNGRPNTKWEDLKVAHEAFNELIGQGKFESFFIDLKSWCASENIYRIKDEQGKSKEFSSFIELSKSDFENPVEYYAYFLGLYINNQSMSKNIYTYYKMSFPVSFREELRKAIIASFEKGIRKSFPNSLLLDSEFEDEFVVEEGLREPVAYAITALEKYHFNERVKNGESCCYAVFDFGGGTTDFDFGIYSKIDENDPEDPDNDFNDYKITRLGDGGDPDLGGEKLLQYLAFQVLKNNVKKIEKEHNIRIPIKPYDGCKKAKEYSEIQTYVIPDSTNAKRNMFELMKLLRWTWEDPDNSKNDSYVDTMKANFENYYIENVGLLDEFDEKHSINLILSNDENGESIDFQKLLREKIEKGIEEFFKSVSANFKKSPVKNIDEISIFLAGNSTKSKLFNKILSEYLANDYEYNTYKEDYKEDDKKRIAEEAKKKAEWVANIKRELGNENLRFVVYPPLKTKEAKEKLQNMGYDLDINDPEEPSGKTGVAYGMLVDRVRIDEFKDVDTVFQYYVGVERDRKLAKLALEKGDVFGEDAEWKQLCAISSKQRTPYKFYYTKSDEAIDEDMPISDKTPNKSIKIKLPKDKTYIFIRPLNHNTVECKVADSKDSLKDIEESWKFTLE